MATGASGELVPQPEQAQDQDDAGRNDQPETSLIAPAAHGVVLSRQSSHTIQGTSSTHPMHASGNSIQNRTASLRVQGRRRDQTQGA